MLEIFHYDFMIRAFIAGGVIALSAPLIGMFLVVRRYSLMADTLSHVSLMGIAIGLLVGINPIITAIVVSVVAAIGIEKLRTGKRVLGESALALFLSGGLAVAAVLIGFAHGFNVNLFSYLFGSISTVAAADLYLIISLGIIVLLAVLFLYKELFLTSFDEELAQANGVPTKTLSLVLIILAAVTVALAMRIIGVLLLGALMVIPVVTAMQFGQGFRRTMSLAVIASVIAVFSGLFISFYLNLPSGATIVVIALIMFVLSLFWHPILKRG